jgi:selenocysteine lyase/cysteine desulfurase
MRESGEVKIGQMTLEQLRDQFPVSEEWIFLDHASISSQPRRAVEAMNAWNERRSREAFTDARKLEGWTDIVERTRDKMSRLIGASSQEIAFTGGTAHGIDIVANGLGLRAGDRVILNSLEHPANIGQWINMARSEGIEVDVVQARDDGCLYVEDFQAAMTSRTRVLALGSVCSYNGFRMQMEELSGICHQRGIRVLVDAIQEVGAMRVDVKKSGIDFLAGGTYKWLLSPHGHGYLYVSEDAMEDVAPTQMWWDRADPAGGRGWGSFVYPNEFTVDSETPYAYAEGAKRFEVGCIDWSPLLGLEACLDLLFELGPENVERRILSLGDFLIEGFDEMGVTVRSPRQPGARSGIVSIEESDPDAMVSFCEERRIRVAPRGGGVRIAPHVYNTKDELARVLETVAAYREGQ